MHLNHECEHWDILFHQMQTKKGKNDDTRRKVSVMLLSGQKLELTCDTKTVCKDVFDMVVAHIGLVEHHLFGLASLRGKNKNFLEQIGIEQRDLTTGCWE